MFNKRKSKIPKQPIVNIELIELKHYKNTE